MAIVLVQGNARGSSATNSITVTMASNPTNGNLLVAAISTDGYPDDCRVTSITQTNVAWTRAIALYDTVNREVWYGVVSASATTGITVALNNTAIYGAVANVCEWSGLTTASPVDKTATFPFTNPTIAPGTGTTAATTQNDELCVGDIISTETESAPTNSFTLLDGTNLQSSIYSGYVYRIVSVMGTYGTTVTQAIDNWGAGCIATFKATVAGGTVVPVFLHHLSSMNRAHQSD